VTRSLEVQAAFISPLFVLFCLTVLALFGLALALSRLRHRRQLSRGKVIGWGTLGIVSLLPLLAVGAVLGWYVVPNFPFTSGVIAHGSSPNGIEACVVQTFKGAEPYQVSLYARHAGEPWRWHYLAHQDNRWRDCRIEFTASELRVYTGSTLRKSFPITATVAASDSDDHGFPANYIPEQILAEHNARYKE
jgi:hypothetical protein